MGATYSPPLEAVCFALPLQLIILFSSGKLVLHLQHVHSSAFRWYMIPIAPHLLSGAGSAPETLLSEHLHSLPSYHLLSVADISCTVDGNSLQRMCARPRTHACQIYALDLIRPWYGRRSLIQQLGDMGRCTRRLGRI